MTGTRYPHYHAVNSTLTAEEAAQCVYATETEAREMVRVFLELATTLAKASVREIGRDDYLVNERGSTNRVAVEKCRKTDCPPFQNLNKAKRTPVTYGSQSTRR